MFEAQFEKASVFKRIIDSISTLIQDVNFDCTPSGITLQALDSAHVSLVSLVIRQEGFEHYRCDRSITLGVSLDSLGKILKCAGNDDSLVMRAQDGGDSLTIILRYKNKESEFQMKLMEINLEKLSIPDSTYNSTVQMSSQEFQRVINSLQSFGDNVSIKISDGGINFLVSGNIQGTISIRPSEEINDTATMITCEEEINLTFAMRYLSNFAKATNLSSTVMLKLSYDLPLIVEYLIEDSTSRNYIKEETKKFSSSKRIGHIRFYLAPKIEDDN